jgi:NADPH:quinone reductase-like Zn-dependent oxidoreductase
MSMRAIVVREFGGIDRLVEERLPVPTPSAGQVLVRVKAASVGPWDALVREGKSNSRQPFPVVIGSDLSGVVERVGAEVTAFRPGDEVFGVTNDAFTGAYAEYALAAAESLARKPARSSHVEASSIPVVAVTASKMLFEHARVGRGTRVAVFGAAGNVGAYAVQLARRAGAEITAVGHEKDLEAMRSLGPARVVVTGEPLPQVDAVIDTVGGESLARSFDAVVRGGVVVSVVEKPDAAKAAAAGVRADYFIVQVRSAALGELAALVEANEIATQVGEVLELSQAREAHEMLAGRPHRRGKIVLEIGR